MSLPHPTVTAHDGADKKCRRDRKPVVNPAAQATRLGQFEVAGATTARVLKASWESADEVSRQAHDIAAIRRLADVRLKAVRNCLELARCLGVSGVSLVRLPPSCDTPEHGPTPAAAIYEAGPITRVKTWTDRGFCSLTEHRLGDAAAAIHRSGEITRALHYERRATAEFHQQIEPHHLRGTAPFHTGTFYLIDHHRQETMQALPAVPACPLKEEDTSAPGPLIPVQRFVYGSEGGESMAEMNRYSILVVDDENEVLESLRGLLGFEYDVHTATTAADGLDIFRRRNIHVVISDQRMPDMIGAQLLRQVQDERPETMRILLTDYIDMGTMVEAINQGHIFTYISKPWEPGEMQAMVRMACEQHEQCAQRERLLMELRSHLAEGQTLLRHLRDEAYGALNLSGQEEVDIYMDKGRGFLSRLRHMLASG